MFYKWLLNATIKYLTEIFKRFLQCDYVVLEATDLYTYTYVLLVKTYICINVFLAYIVYARYGHTGYLNMFKSSQLRLTQLSTIIRTGKRYRLIRKPSCTSQLEELLYFSLNIFHGICLRSYWLQILIVNTCMKCSCIFIAPYN